MKKLMRVMFISVIISIMIFYSVIGQNNDRYATSQSSNNELTIDSMIKTIKNDQKYNFKAEAYDLFKDNKVEDFIFTHSINLISVGDIMAHTLQFEAAYNQETDTYNFDEQFQEMWEKLSSKDFAIGNLETVFAGKDKTYSGKNMIFNAPDSLAESLKKSGIDMLTTSNNHALDRGYYGISRTIDVLDALDILHTGTYKTKEASETILITEKHGIAFALLSYSYSTNGWPMPKDHPYALNMLDGKKIVSDIKKARSLGADIVIVATHWGNEYQLHPDIHQKNLAQAMFYAGADIILGTHPHVIQPFEHKKLMDVSGKEKDKFIIYSQGNFISGQRTHPRDVGMYINFKLTREGSGPVFVDEVTVMPTWVQSSYVNNKRYMRILDIKDTLDRYLKGEINHLTQFDYQKLKAIERTYLKHLFSYSANKAFTLNENNEYLIYSK